MEVVELLTRLGGVATRAQLIDATSRREVDGALATGGIAVLSRGRYALPELDHARAVAHGLSGVLCLASAALEHGWAVKAVPSAPQVAVRPNRKVAAGRRAGVEVRWFDLGPDDVDGHLTSPDRTLLDCLRHLPFDEALAIADSALRSGYPRARLRALVRDARGRDAVRMRLVGGSASAAAANPFESVLRAIALPVRGLTLVPQVPIYRGGVFLGRPDLVDERLRIVVEADSFEWHGDRAALRADARRYNAFVTDGWLVLRFSWEDVMLAPGDVAGVLTAAVAEREQMICPACRAAS
ncbi:DUF559 domain-containing protein [Nocardioides sp. MH1]|uniref:DUF559 domain-containing protein n=1 Tax=Nocardioides sp. MH1 TaxID=3242490 RepID=UPI003521491B